MGTTIVIIPVLLTLALSIWSVLDIAKSKLIKGNMKTAWIILIFGFPFLGSFLYFHFRKRHFLKRGTAKPGFKESITA
jgi:hypothetical protein